MMHMTFKASMHTVQPQFNIQNDHPQSAQASKWTPFKTVVNVSSVTVKIQVHVVI